MSDVGSVHAAPQQAAVASLKAANDQQKQDGEAAVDLIQDAGQVQKNVDPAKGHNIDIQA